MAWSSRGSCNVKSVKLLMPYNVVLQRALLRFCPCPYPPPKHCMGTLTLGSRILVGHTSMNHNTNILIFVNESFDKIDKTNGAYLKGRRTSDNLFVLNGLIERQLMLGKSLYICYVDFSKAFDLINRHILFYRIINLGWHGKVINTLRDLYSNTYFRVQCNGK